MVPPPNDQNSPSLARKPGNSANPGKKKKPLDGTLPTPAPPLGAVPTLRPDVVAGLTQLLIREQKMKRPPQQAARLLAYIIELHKRDLPFPKREIVAELLEISVPTIDTALSARLAEGYLSCEIRVIEGNAKNRSSSIKQKYYHPSQDLIDVFDYYYGTRK